MGWEYFFYVFRWGWDAIGDWESKLDGGRSHDMTSLSILNKKVQNVQQMVSPSPTNKEIMGSNAQYHTAERRVL